MSEAAGGRGSTSSQLHTSAHTPLSDAQQKELQAALLGSFKQDAAMASHVLARSLSDKAKRQLLAALEHSGERPGLSRCAVSVRERACCGSDAHAHGACRSPSVVGQLLWVGCVASQSPLLLHVLADPHLFFVQDGHG